MKKPFWTLGIIFPIFTILTALYYIQTGTMIGSANHITAVVISFGIIQCILGIFIGKQLQIKNIVHNIALFVVLNIVSLGISGIIYTILYEYIPYSFQGFSFEILITAAMFSIALLIIPILLLNGLVLTIYIFLFHKTI
ncbi:hypothetical protein [Bacillus cereus]|uniref:hypothetical protein n=1 Tax=Bacillus cereus TaxID=1396 RepID=UPI000BEB3A29|nr:hypothetical protein [Bacillus cereus]PEF67961.1 hypothetical protein CON35_09820 [Bacillus cereus]